MWDGNDMDIGKDRRRNMGSFKTYGYLTCCIESRAEDIDAMVDHPQCKRLESMNEIIDMLDDCDLTGAIYISQYANDDTIVPRLEKDWAVSFYKSVFKGQECYYICHSATEIIFVKKSVLGSWLM